MIDQEKAPSVDKLSLFGCLVFLFHFKKMKNSFFGTLSKYTEICETKYVLYTSCICILSNNKRVYTL